MTFMVIFRTGFAGAIGCSPDDVDVVRVFEGETLPPPDVSRAAIITGSSGDGFGPTTLERENRRVDPRRGGGRDAAVWRLLWPPVDGLGRWAAMLSTIPKVGKPERRLSI